MNPHSALAVVQSSDDDLDLSAAQRRFCELIVEGRTNQDAYLEAFETTNKSTASSNSSHLLDQAKVQRYLQIVQQRAMGPVAEKLVPWAKLLPKAQAIIVATAEGRLRSRLQYEAAMYLVNRVIGTPVSTAEVHVSDQSRITGAIKLLGSRMKAVEVA